MSREIIIFRCRYSIEFKDLFAFRLVNANRMGSIVGCSHDYSVVYVLWDGRTSVDSLYIGYVDIIEEVIESKSLNSGMKLMASDKLKLLQEEARKRHADKAIPAVKVEEPEENKIVLKMIPPPVRVKKIKEPVFKKEKPAKVIVEKRVDFEKVKNTAVKSKSIFDQPQEKSVDISKLNKHEGRAIFNPADRIKRPPALYSNSKSLYGIDYNDV